LTNGTLNLSFFDDNNNSNNTHTGTFNSPLSGTTPVSWYQKGKTNLEFNEARDSEWQWHQLGHMQVCTSFQTDKHASTPPLVFTGWIPFLPPNQQRQSTEGNNNNITNSAGGDLVSNEASTQLVEPLWRQLMTEMRQDKV